MANDTPTLADKIKVALRISTSTLDTEIADNIASAKAEMIRAGVDEDLVTAEGYLVAQAIKTYVLAFMGSDVDQNEKYMESFKYQMDNLRKSDMTQTTEG